MFAAYDRIAGKVLVPLSIHLCRLTRLDQYRLHDYLWLLFYWCWFTYAFQNSIHWLLMILVTLATIFWTVKVAVRDYTNEEDAIRRPNWASFQRRALLLFETYHTGIHILFALGLLGSSWATRAKFDLTCPSVWFALIADYAITIRNLPPSESKATFKETEHAH